CGSDSVVDLLCVVFCIFFFFFSSRRRHTRFDCDWSSDVCSSDLPDTLLPVPAYSVSGCCGSRAREETVPAGNVVKSAGVIGSPRSEERRVGKECRSRWSSG